MILPTITFLCGPSGVGKTTLANLLFDKTDGLQAHSLKAPLWGAARGAFFDCDPSLDLTKEPEKRTIPGLQSFSVSQFVRAFHDDLKREHGDNVLGQLATAFTKEATEFFDKVIFDDGDRSLIEDIRFVAKEFGEDNCLIVNVSRGEASIMEAPLDSKKIRCISFQNNFSSPAEALTAFLALSPLEPAK